MAFLANEVFDDGLSVLSSDADAIYICSQDPGTVYTNVATYAMGNKVLSASGIASPSDRTSGGREVVTEVITDGSATATGDATHYAVVDTTATTILAVSTLSSTLSVVSGGSFGLESFSIGIPDPTA